MGKYNYQDEELYSNQNNNSLLEELMNETNYDIMENTLELDTLKLEDDEAQMLTPPVKKEKTKKRKWYHLPITTAEDHHLEYAFVHCSILGFITAFMGLGMFAYIMNHI